MKPIRLLTFLAAIAVAPSVALAQGEPARPAPVRSTTAPPTVGPPVERIETASALSTEPLGSIASVRELPDGRVLLNDGARRRLLLMDTTLAVVAVVLDSLTQVSNTYGVRPGALIPYRADSTLFVDPASYAVLVLDPAGQVARVRSVWRVQDLPWLTNPSGAYGWPGVDAKGRVVYRVPARAPRPISIQASGVPHLPPEPDSAFLVAVDLATRRADTLGVMRIPKVGRRVRRTAQGALEVDPVINPLPSTDDWAVLPDGRVAVVRGRDYRIEYLNPDGSWSSSAKLPFEWRRITDEEKERMVDSVRTARQRTAMTSFVTSMIRWVNLFGRQYPAGFTVPEGYVVQPGLPRGALLPPGVELPANYIYACAAGEEPTMTPHRGTVAAVPGGAPAAGREARSGAVHTMVEVSAGGASTPSGPPAGVGMPGGSPGGPAGTPSCIPTPVMVGGGNTPPPPTVRPVAVVDPSEIPDYRPPLATGGAARADADGNLWIRTVPPRPIPGGPVYDVVSPEGELVRRLQLPPGYTLVGFGKGKVVYLSMRDPRGIHLARVRLR